MIALASILTGCAAPTGVKFIDTKISNTDRERIFVATSRQASGKADFSGERGKELKFADYEISIPPTHQVGKIQWPSRTPDPKRHFAVASAHNLKGAQGFKSAINDALRGFADTSVHEKEVILFVHGYNTDFSEGLYRSAQMTHDFEVAAPFTLFSWPSAGEPGLYLYDRDSVKASRDHLAQTIRLLAESDAQHITLVAHSLGTELLMETLRQMALGRSGLLPKKIRGVVLIAPDLDVDVFNSQLRSIKKLPESFAIFVSEKDEALQISSFLTGDRARVGSNIDETLLERKGIAVIDVTGFDGGDGLNHMTAVTSPNLVALLKGLMKSGKADLLLRNEGKQASSLSDQVIGTATLPIRIVLDGTQRILNQ